jgi:S-adenosylmethionine:tRNA ribosyltransferase-isomerase
MIAASLRIQRPSDARLMVVDAKGHISHQHRSVFVDLLDSGDLVVANDAATMPASLSGIHVPSGRPVEVRLAGRRSLAAADVHEFSAVVFGAGNFRARTENRPLPPRLSTGDRLRLGPLSARIVRLLEHPRLVLLRFDGFTDDIWAGIAHHGRPIQYSHVPVPLAMWDVWTPIAGSPVAFEPPSAGFTLDWRVVARMHARNIDFATITHAAGISSTGDPELDKRLPFDEPYRISHAAAVAIGGAKARNGRVVAVGTTVVRALEHAARPRGILAGEGVATQRISSQSELHIVDGILTGTHQAGTSHYELLRAFVSETVLNRVTEELDAHGYRTHEFGDSILILRAPRPLSREEGILPMTNSTVDKTTYA